MSIKKLSVMMLFVFSLAALLSGCGASSKEGSINLGDVAKIDETACRVCHSSSLDKNGLAIVSTYLSSPHNVATNANAGCQGCHGGGAQHNGVGPLPYPDPVASARCSATSCHDSSWISTSTFGNNTTVKRHHVSSTAKTVAASYGTGYLSKTTNCGVCHSAHKPLGFFVTGTTDTTISCLDCHAFNQNRNAYGTFVNDNNGVRAITTEFSKWSHHVTGVTLNAVHCVACHLEGKVVSNQVVIDPTKHMVDNKTHLRNADTDEDMAWNPDQPSFTTMDNFCMSCHDSDGATSVESKNIQSYINSKGLAATGKTASATNPFGDTISNQYDMLQRPAVVDAKGQFDTSNPSHHAVRGKRYSGRTRIESTRHIDNEVAFVSNSSASLPGARSTIYDAGKFEASYTTLADYSGETGRNGGTTLGDDSTLHCGDCHTVGQYRAADVGSRYNKAVIGAHGSNNEYLLRNNIGTDALHQGVDISSSSATGKVGTSIADYGSKPYLVCFNCHAFATYGSIGGATGAAGKNHAGEYAEGERCNGPFNTTRARVAFSGYTGEGRLRSIETNKNSTNFGKPETDGDMFGNMLGIQCANCHNSGVSANNIFGGIHGSKTTTYTDGMGNTSKHYRFLPGFGNIMFVPGTRGGFTGGTTATFYQYSGNRNGTSPAVGTLNGGTALVAADAATYYKTVGQTYTQLPVRTTVAGTTAANITTYDGATVTARPSYTTSATALTRGSYQYTTGGVSLDANWEQKTQQPVAGVFDFSAKAAGCYTLSPAAHQKSQMSSGAPINSGTSVVATYESGAKATTAAAASIAAGAKGPDGTTGVFDNWGGCDDHSNLQGSGTNVFRKVLRKVTY